MLHRIIDKKISNLKENRFLTNNAFLICGLGERKREAALKGTASDGTKARPRPGAASPSL